MPDHWVDVCIQTELDAGELLGMLDDPAVQGAWEDAGMIHLYWPADQWDGERLTSLQRVLSRMGRGRGVESSLSVDRLPARDWNRLWAQSVKPLHLGRRLVIRPSWEPVVLQPNQVEIILDPRQAFGTGHHATTRMLLEWLDGNIRGGESVLDVGAGSGILAMAALKLGASSAVEVEYDPVAADCARDYARENRFGPELNVVCGTLRDLPQPVRPDLVLANLDRQTLLATADELAALGTAGARVLCSGLLIDQEGDIVGRYSRLGLYPVQRREQDGWVALEFVRSESCEGLG
jgi:ribosomal protein L11 methyltransferase